jgi:hypothetical protein
MLLFLFSLGGAHPHEVPWPSLQSQLAALPPAIVRLPACGSYTILITITRIAGRDHSLPVEAAV